MDRPLRLITANPVDRLARTVEALLVVASQPLSVEEIAVAANDDAERIETALRLLGERYSEGRSGIVLERVEGGWAFRASRGPCTRPDIARIRGVAADSVVAGLVERGLIAEAGRDGEAAGAIRYKTTPLFERVFDLESLAALPRLDDLGGEADEIRARLEAVAEKRPAYPR